MPSIVHQNNLSHGVNADFETQALQIFTEDSEGNEEFCTVPVSSSSFALRFLLFNLIRLSTINYRLSASALNAC